MYGRADYPSQNFGDWSTADRQIPGPFFQRNPLSFMSVTPFQDYFKILN